MKINLGLYRLLTRLLLAPVLGYFWWRGLREPAYRDDWRERLGWGPDIAPGAIWIHAASIGEVALAGPLVAALRARYPKRALLLTTVTPTGRARAAARLGETVAMRYLPLDTPGATRRFIRRSRPCLALFVETELWPNLIAAIANAGVPLALIGARLSASSAARYARVPLAGLAAFMLTRISLIGAASDAHARRFLALGAPPARVILTGNLKYERAAKPPAVAAGAALRRSWHAADRPLWVAASTHAGEERRLLAAFAIVRRARPDTLLVIAPRHPQRFNTVARLLQRQGVAVARRSEGAAVTAATAVVLADTLGEVSLFYAAADVVFVGGSLVPGVGGHNVIEAAGCARPLCVGPHIREWRDVVDALVARRAAAVCAGPAALAAQVNDWLGHPETARAAGAAGAACVAERRGALRRSLKLIDALLDAC